MNTMSREIPQGDGAFLKLVDFKWLMAGLGWWVDLSRLQRDKRYAGECVQHALTSGSELLRQKSMALLPLVADSGAHGSVGVPHMSAELAT
jgi:hypothetical protein